MEAVTAVTRGLSYQYFFCWIANHRMKFHRVWNPLDLFVFSFKVCYCFTILFFTVKSVRDWGASLTRWGPLEKVIGILDLDFTCLYCLVCHPLCSSSHSIAWPFSVTGFEIVPHSQKPKLTLVISCHGKDGLVSGLWGGAVCPVVDASQRCDQIL